jgi:hypothetical protein
LISALTTLGSRSPKTIFMCSDRLVPPHLKWMKRDNMPATSLIKGILVHLRFNMPSSRLPPVSRPQHSSHTSSTTRKTPRHVNGWQCFTTLTNTLIREKYVCQFHTNFIH